MALKTETRDKLKTINTATVLDVSTLPTSSSNVIPLSPSSRCWSLLLPCAYMPAREDLNQRRCSRRGHPSASDRGLSARRVMVWTAARCARGVALILVN